jgi:hypothetical protein
MVAVIHNSQSFRRAVHYNENKVKESKAVCIGAINYPKYTEDLTLLQKLSRLANQASLNEKVKVNCVHISLNFDPSEKLSAEKMTMIARSYIEKIGFGAQPYLIYQHHDAGHPHLHIVTTNIKVDGKRIPLHNLGRDKSEPARKQVEQEFELIPAGSKQVREAYTLPPVKISYGRSATKRAVASVVNNIISQYKFTSLAEFNAVLKMYNVTAQRGEPGSRTHERGGLVYRVLDEQGNAVGVPIKASNIFFKPTLKTLEGKFIENETARKPHRQRIRTTIDWILLGKEKTMRDFVKELEREGIQVILRSNMEGRLYGITFVDHRTKCVFNGSDLGKEYSAQGIVIRCQKGEIQQPSFVQPGELSQVQNTPHTKDILLSFDQWQIINGREQPPPPELRSGRKKRRKRPKL